MRLTEKRLLCGQTKETCVKQCVFDDVYLTRDAFYKAASPILTYKGDTFCNQRVFDAL
jgi:hypothetical protein